MRIDFENYFARGSRSIKITLVKHFDMCEGLDSNTEMSVKALLVLQTASALKSSSKFSSRKDLILLYRLIIRIIHNLLTPPKVSKLAICI
jgi:hypothetical protein